MQQGDAQNPAQPGAQANVSLVASRLCFLLFSEVCLLAAVAGILFSRHTWPGLLLLGLTVLMDLPRSKNRERLACLALAFLVAFVYTGLRAPTAPPVPDWLREAAFVVPNAKGELLPPKALRVRGRVEQCTLLPGNRARTILTDLVPLPGQDEHDRSGPATAAPEPYAGKVVWTWYQPSLPLLPGQSVEALVRLAPQRGMANPGTWDLDSYWHDRGVWFRAWSAAKTAARILEPPDADVSLAEESAALRQEARRGFIDALPHVSDPETGTTRLARAAAIPLALLFGDRSHLAPEDTDLFARATLAHSLALSGLHLGFALLAGYALALGLGRLFPELWLRVTRPLATLVLALPVAGLQFWLGDAPLSLMRAACMLVVWTLLLLLRRPRVLLDGLCAALAFLLLLNPLSLFDISLQLSVLSVAAIALCLPGITGASGFLASLLVRKQTPGRTTRFVRDGLILLGVSFCIQVALLPLTLRTFGSSGVLFPLNLLWLPVLGTVVMPLSFLGLLASCLGLEAPAAALLHGATLPCQALLEFLQWLDSAGLLFSPLMPRPHWLSCAGFWLLCLVVPGVIPSFWDTRKRVSDRGGKARFAPGSGGILLCFAGLALLLLPPLAALHDNNRERVRLTMLDVGQGQSVLLEWGGETSGRVLVDGGGFNTPTFDVGRSIVAPVLTDNALPRLDAVIASHPDTDHLSGLVYILDKFRVGRYFGNGGEATPGLAAREHAVLRRTGLARETLGSGDKLELGPDLFLEALWPSPAARDTMNRHEPGQEKSNNASIVLRLVWKGRPLALLCGDIEAPALEQLLREHPESLTASVLVLPHHGSASSLVPGFHAAVRPLLALASCGYGNRWGFPSRAVRQSLEDRNIPLRSTAESGQIRVEWTDPEHGPALATARE